MKQLIFVRHGESTANVTKTCAGMTDVELSPLGIAQAQAARDTIVREYVPNLIVTSPLMRARHTADIISKGFLPSVPVIEQPLCVERSRGDLEGKPTSLSEGLSDTELVSHGAESEASMLLRAQKLLEWLKARPEDTIILSAHNQFGRSFIAYCTGVPRDTVPKIPNAQPFVIDIQR